MREVRNNMPRPRSTGVLIITLVIGIFAATVVSVILNGLIDHSGVVYRVLLNYFEYNVGPATIDLVMVSFTLGFVIKINFLTVLSMFAAYYYWKYRI